jgi:hypothetical protein
MIMKIWRVHVSSFTLNEHRSATSWRRQLLGGCGGVHGLGYNCLRAFRRHWPPLVNNLAVLTHNFVVLN